MPILQNQAKATYKLSGQNFSTNSNITTFTVITPSLTVVKSQNIQSGIVGDTVSFTITLNNTSTSLPLTNVVVKDDLPTAGYTYVNNTAKIDNVLTNDNPVSGINIGTMLPSTTKVVTFDATVN